jgi:hypothetical protein
MGQYVKKKFFSGYAPTIMAWVVPAKQWQEVPELFTIFS